jgi:hypothetical protein
MSAAASQWRMAAVFRGCRVTRRVLENYDKAFEELAK